MDRPISFEEERNQLIAAIEKYPDDLSLKSRLTTVNHTIAMDLLQDSVQTATEVRSSKPEDYWANYNLALSYLYYWRPMDAWSFALKAVQIDPEQKYGYELLFNIASRISDPAKIMPDTTGQLVKIFDQAQKLHPYLDLYREAGFLIRQQTAINKGIPPILINTLPKSGTIYIRGRLSESLDIPYQQLAIAPLYNDPIPSWLDGFSKGGAVAAEHLHANPQTIKLLNQSGLKRLVVHVRDPRQSALSLFHFQAKQSKYGGPVGTVAGDLFRANSDMEEAFRLYCDTFIPWTMNWLRGWIDCADTNNLNFSIKFTTYDSFLESESRFFSDLLNYFEISSSLFDDSKPLSDKHKEHFRKGGLSEWKEVFSEDTQKHISSLIEEDIRHFFNWHK